MKNVLKTCAPALALAALLCAPGGAWALEILVTPTVAPNAFGSPSYAQWVDNAVHAQETGVSSDGNPNSPTYYHAQSNVQANQVIVTGFPSWLGKADPGSVFGAAYANELGNRMHFALTILGQGSQFSISQLSFEAHSSDAGDELGFGFSAGDYDYSSSYVGVRVGADGILGTADDVYITSGPNTQLVDALYGRGSGNSDAAYCPGCTIAEQQAAIDAAASYWTKPATFTGVYKIGDFKGSGTFNIAPVPELATWAMLLIGLGMIGVTLRRRRSDAIRIRI